MTAVADQHHGVRSLARMVSQLSVEMGRWTLLGDVWHNKGCSTPIGPWSGSGWADLSVAPSRTSRWRADAQLVPGVTNTERRTLPLPVNVLCPRTHHGAWGSAQEAMAAMSALLYDDHARHETLLRIPDWGLKRLQSWPALCDSMHASGLIWGFGADDTGRACWTGRFEEPR